MSDIYNRVSHILGTDWISENVPMNQHTTFRVGGMADCMAVPENEKQLADILRVCTQEQIPYYLIGNGSNLLVSDRGYRGVIIQLFRNWNRSYVDGESICAKAGAMLSVLARQALKESLTGLEFASGIPGTLGGAVVMNAGAYGAEMKDVIRSVRMMTADGTIKEAACGDMQFSYRTSLAAKGGYIVLSAVLDLSKGSRERIMETMEQLRKKRAEKQPLDLPSAGSTFKRPAGYFAGKLIMDAGLAGYCVGGAKVSEKHCGFVVNTGSATALDIKKLMDEVQAKVYEKFGVMLEPEVKMLGEFA